MIVAVGLRDQPQLEVGGSGGDRHHKHPESRRRQPPPPRHAAIAPRRDVEVADRDLERVTGRQRTADVERVRAEERAARADADQNETYDTVSVC